jgi:hypothetical protein
MDIIQLLTVNNEKDHTGVLVILSPRQSRQRQITLLVDVRPDLVELPTFEPVVDDFENPCWVARQVQSLKDEGLRDFERATCWWRRQS